MSIIIVSTEFDTNIKFRNIFEGFKFPFSLKEAVFNLLRMLMRRVGAFTADTSIAASRAIFIKNNAGLIYVCIRLASTIHSSAQL